MDTQRDMPKTTITTSGTARPSWYDAKHDSTWDRVKEALRRDWEQTKNDFGADTARDLNQSAGDTIKQATGSDALPLPSQKTRPDAEWTDVEPAVRYGYGARSQYATHVKWDSELETKLEGEWNGLGTGRKWDDVKPSIRRGWDSSKPQS